MGLRRLITEFLWPPSSSIIRPWLPYSIKVLVKTNQTSPNSMGLRRLITEFPMATFQLHHQTLITIEYQTVPYAAGQHTAPLSTARNLPCGGFLGDPLGTGSHWNTKTGWFFEPFDFDCDVVRRISDNIPWSTDKIIGWWRLVGGRCRKKRIRVGLPDGEESLRSVFHIR
ncbi:hypothetical protein EVAR_67199_1 [Eumeta japonica]|uniref:Uncharacterized protein n=1 Tax=Eumeta variegata TaxID=151549 RepID=A0A4C2A7U4_EUMVA|nr:hypothetical protein EVAR_67199_1 [Eumeta japonica]